MRCGDRLEQVGVLNRLGALPEDRPGDRRPRRGEVEVAKVAQEQQSRFGATAEELGSRLADPREQTTVILLLVVDGVGVEVDAVARGLGGEPRDVALAPRGERSREMEDVVLDLVTLADPQKLRGELRFGDVGLTQGGGDLHGRPSSCTKASAPPVVAGTGPSGREAVVVGASEGRPAPPGATRSMRTAAVLKIGCLEAGSHSVIVSSLAARS